MTNNDRDGEEDIIQRYFAPLAAGFPGAYGLADDCASLTVPPGHELIVTTDPVIAGVHFFPDEMPENVAWKALAVNVSDLVAKGAAPLAYTMAAAFPERPSEAWLGAFARGLAKAQTKFDCQLAGGDTDRTPGPLMVSITAFGTSPAGTMVRRSTAKPGDWLYLTGAIGDAALGLKLRQDPSLSTKWGLGEDQIENLESRYRAPSPVLGFEAILRGQASAAIDISDGLVKDFERLCRASGVGGRIDAATVPLSSAARAVLDAGGATLADLMTGGEDYEILLTVPQNRASAFESAAKMHGAQATRIGSITRAGRIVVLDATGEPMKFTHTGWDHFAQ